jgi:hypothetical protein
MFQSIISHAGRQHAQFGAKPPHFAAFGDALLWGLEHQLGDTFYSGTERGLEHALRRRSKRDDPSGKITSLNGLRQGSSRAATRQDARFMEPVA